MVDCTQTEAMTRPWLNGEFINAFICTYAPEPAAQLFMALVVFGGMGIGLFVFSGSIILPAVLGIMLAGAVFIFMPPTVTNLALVAGLLIVSIGGILLVRRVKQA